MAIEKPQYFLPGGSEDQQYGRSNRLGQDLKSEIEESMMDRLKAARQINSWKKRRSIYNFSYIYFVDS